MPDEKPDLTKRETHFEELSKYGKKIEFPELKGAEYIVSHLDNLGWALQGANGYIPLTFQEIYAYMQATQTPLNSEEVLLIKKMSEAYVAQSYDKDPMARMPYGDTEDNKIQLTTDQILAIFGATD